MADAIDITGALGSGLDPCADVRIVIEDFSYTLRKGMARDTKCIIERTLTSIV